MQRVEVDVEPAPLALLVTGVPGSGKSTVAARLAARLPCAAHVSADAVGAFLVSGRVDPPLPDEPSGGAEGEATRQLFLRARNASLLCDSFFRAGVTPILDDVVVRQVQLDYYLESIVSRPLELVVLAPSIESILARDRGREKRGIGERWTWLDERLRTELAGVGTWIDSTEQAPEETVEAILAATGLRAVT